MSYATLENKIRALPGECLDEVSDYIDYILFRMQMKKKILKKGELMSEKEQVLQIIDQLPDYKMGRLLVFLQGI